MSTDIDNIEQLDEASVEREKQRTESEARDIIHDVDRLYTFPEDKKTRWIWELLQNAKDVANTEESPSRSPSPKTSLSSLTMANLLRPSTCSQFFIKPPPNH